MLGAGDQGVEGQNWDGPCDNDKVRQFPIMVLPICITGLTLVVTSLWIVPYAQIGNAKTSSTEVNLAVRTTE